MTIVIGSQKILIDEMTIHIAFEPHKWFFYKINNHCFRGDYFVCLN